MNRDKLAADLDRDRARAAGRARASGRSGVVAGAILAGCLAGCANIIGITDTSVTDDGGADATVEDVGTTASDTGAGPGADATVDAAGDADGGGGPGADAADGGPVPDARGSDAADAGNAADGDGGKARDGGDASVGADAADGGPGDAEAGPVDAAPDQADSGDGGCTPACPPNTPTCVNGQCVVRGPSMVAVSTFWVDSTEVTVAQYKQFLADPTVAATPQNQPAACSWNTSYYDQTTNPFSPDTFPITNVDWCDARAFCAWAGKRLCGTIGGGSITLANVETPNVSQWFLACGGPGGSSHPSTADVCNSNFGNGSLDAVATNPGCEGFYPGLFDLEGNAAEWVDSCDPPDGGTDGGPANDTCYLMGGGFFDEKSFCDESYAEPRNETAISFGFRCCSQ